MQTLALIFFIFNQLNWHKVKSASNQFWVCSFSLRLLKLVSQNLSAANFEHIFNAYLCAMRLVETRSQIESLFKTLSYSKLSNTFNQYYNNFINFLILFLFTYFKFTNAQNVIFWLLKLKFQYLKHNFSLRNKTISCFTIKYLNDKIIIKTD
jgi:hypothetical protein